MSEIFTSPRSLTSAIALSLGSYSAMPVTSRTLPSEYLVLLRLSDGGEGEFDGYPGYVRVWSALSAINFNDGYQVQHWLPGFVGFGDDGGDQMVGFDTRNGEPYTVSAIPCAPMRWTLAMGTVADFGAFIRQLLPVH